MTEQITRNRPKYWNCSGSACRNGHSSTATNGIHPMKETETPNGYPTCYTNVGGNFKDSDRRKNSQAIWLWAASPCIQPVSSGLTTLHPTSSIALAAPRTAAISSRPGLPGTQVAKELIAANTRLERTDI